MKTNGLMRILSEKWGSFLGNNDEQMENKNNSGKSVNENYHVSNNNISPLSGM